MAHLRLRPSAFRRFHCAMLYHNLVEVCCVEGSDGRARQLVATQRKYAPRSMIIIGHACLAQRAQLPRRASLRAKPPHRRAQRPLQRPRTLPLAAAPSLLPPPVLCSHKPRSEWGDPRVIEDTLAHKRMVTMMLEMVFVLYTVYLCRGAIPRTRHSALPSGASRTTLLRMKQRDRKSVV